MARSVSTPRDSAFVEYANFQVDGDPDWEWDYAIEDFQSQILEAFPSTCASTEWIGRENHAVAENNFAYFGVSEYCGLVAMWVVAKDDDTSAGLRDHWISTIEAKFTKVARSCFGQTLVMTGRFSNGEAFFQPSNGIQKGEMSLGFSSKEGWL